MKQLLNKVNNNNDSIINNNNDNNTNNIDNNINDMKSNDEIEICKEWIIKNVNDNSIKKTILKGLLMFTSDVLSSYKASLRAKVGPDKIIEMLLLTIEIKNEMFQMQQN
jgi:formylmethanofuran:tetrahydromethanopterin formyltransferase